MLDWFEGLAGPQFAAAVLWTFAALILLVIVLVIIKMVRSLTFGTFVAGGRNRKTRLAVMDATAVDSHRRLVLVRRDDVEHLILIGGPTDVVVECDIRLSQPRRPALTGDSGQESAQPARQRQPELAPPAKVTQQAARPADRAQPAAANPARPTVPSSQPAAASSARPAPPELPTPQRQPPARTPEATAPTGSAVKPAPLSAPVTQPPAPQAPQPPAAAQPLRQNSLDDTLLKELEVKFQPPTQPIPAKLPELSLDDEMAKLLGELSSQRKR